MKTKLQFIFFLMMFTSLAWAQGDKTITGTVTDDTGGPLPGVNIVIQGTTTGTQTDFDGNYSLNASSGDVLTYSYLGFETKEVPVADQSEINVGMVSAASDLDEVVVVGYGSQKRSDITGAVVSVKSEEISKQPATSALQSVQGKVAGVNIVSNDSPGSSPTVIMRGLGTSEGGRDPFYVVDGQPVSDIRSISPNDIESIDFLKGASYANIYGIRAANGVILVTTKKGKKGAPVFRLESYYGARSILNKVDMANGAQYRQYFNEASAATGSFQLAPNQAYDTDWYDELLQVGNINNNSFSVSGAGDNIDYFLSYNLYQEEGILQDATYRRGTIRNNNTYHMFDDKFRIISNLNITYTKERPKPFGAFSQAYSQSPLVPVYYDNGLFGQSFVNQTTGVVGYQVGPGETLGRLNQAGNPVASVFFADEDINTTTLQGQLSAELDLTDDLMLTTRFGATKFYSKRHDFNDIRAQWLNGDPSRTAAFFDEQRTDPDGDGEVSTQYANNRYEVQSVESFRWNLESFLTYTKTFDKHDISATLGLSRENFGGGERITALAYDVYNQKRLRSFGYRTDRIFDDSVDQTTGDEFQSTNLQSYFGRVEYNYDSKYYVRGVLRRDGTSDFATGDGNYFDYFPAVSLGWTMSNEAFMENTDWLSNLKFFAGWGKLGNANVPFNVQSIVAEAGSGNTNYVFGPSQGLNLGAALGSPAFPISWEVTEEWEFGFDFGLFNSKLSGTIDYYDRTNTNAILEVRPLLNSEYSNNFFDEAAEITNSGFEFLVNWRDQIGQDFSYNVGFNLSTNKNRVQNVKPAYDGAIGGDLSNGQITKRLQGGQPIFAWWLLESDGVWESQEQIDDNASIGNAAAGHLRYVDQNNDGVIDDRDKKFYGNYIPTFNYGINIGVNYKNIDFSVDGFGVGGNKVYNGLANTRLGVENIPVDLFNGRWTPDNTSASKPGSNRDALASSYWLEDGDYFRLNNVTLGYTFEDFSVISKARLYVTLQNPFMITNYSGFTPELNQDGNPQGTTGVELSAYPTTRTFIFGANFQL
ncbi:SusC/RagA family TonB-linked outer membrane protein [Flavimarina sp. Hel_I_48]|uniref:SusC/RagA family TonB-linked outer membrane protein n=1 Tax=Flavimarina sp. Hel_I_48 TaxID=1392488 RepID=UPI0004DF14C3|nr:TonB-dependent receptor [Flavimarina sp. Hel_I_48]